MGGLHRFMSWDRAILTDSGGFQVFSLNELRKVSEEGVTFRSHLDGSSHFLSPEKAMEMQIGLGADIIMAFDECTEYPADAERVRASMEMTLRWAERSKKYFEEHKDEVPWNGARSSQPSAVAGPRLAMLQTIRQRPEAPRQGTPRLCLALCREGWIGNLRRESAVRTIEIGFPGYAIGGLSVGEPRELTREIVVSTLEHLPADKPRYLMGVGTPEEIAQYAQAGRGHDGLRAADAGGAAWAAVYFRRARFRSSRLAMRRTRVRSIQPATAGCASGIRGRICGIFMPRTSCWRRS